MIHQCHGNYFNDKVTLSYWYSPSTLTRGSDWFISLFDIFAEFTCHYLYTRFIDKVCFHKQPNEDTTYSHIRNNYIRNIGSSTSNSIFSYLQPAFCCGGWPSHSLLMFYWLSENVGRSGMSVNMCRCRMLWLFLRWLIKTDCSKRYFQIHLIFVTNFHSPPILSVGFETFYKQGLFIKISDNLLSMWHAIFFLKSLMLILSS